MEDNFFVCAEWKEIVWNGLEGFFRHPHLFRFQIDCVTLSGCVHCNGRLWRIWRGWTCAHAGLEEFSGIPLWGTLERAPIGGRAPTNWRRLRCCRAILWTWACAILQKELWRLLRRWWVIVLDSTMTKTLLGCRHYCRQWSLCWRHTLCERGRLRRLRSQLTCRHCLLVWLNFRRPWESIFFLAAPFNLHWTCCRSTHLLHCGLVAVRTGKFHWRAFTHSTFPL